MEAPGPTFSIVIPTYRRPERLAACLAALARLDYPRERFEVIVVDDGSGAPPAALVAAQAGRLTVTLVEAVHAGPAAARNAGAARARGDYLAFTDDDCAPDPGWLRALARAATSAPGQMLGGRTVNALADNLWAAASQVLVEYLYAYYNSGAAGTGEARFFTSNNLALPADDFRALGGFDGRFPLAAGEDRDLCDRWLAAGHRMTYAPAAVVRHAHALTPRRFWRQHLTYGRGAWRFHRGRAERGRGRLRLETIGFYAGLVRFPFGRARGWRAAALAALLIVSQAANAAGFALERARRGGTGRGGAGGRDESRPST
jgi:GT2 family glycosyltransferase